MMLNKVTFFLCVSYEEVYHNEIDSYFDFVRFRHVGCLAWEYFMKNLLIQYFFLLHSTPDRFSYTVIDS